MSRRGRVVNRTRQEVLAERARWADSWWLRFRGLMGVRELAAGDGLLFQPGGAIHMFFMRIPLDVLHLDQQARVTHVLSGIRPWRVGPLFVGAGFIVELPAGAAGGTQPGDEIAIEDVVEEHRAHEPRSALAEIDGGHTGI